MIAEGRGAGVAITVANLVGEAGKPDGDKVFDKYYRSPLARGKIGSGLGLYLVKHWVDQLNGRVHYDTSTESDGQTWIRFTVWLKSSTHP